MMLWPNELDPENGLASQRQASAPLLLSLPPEFQCVCVEPIWFPVDRLL